MARANRQVGELSRGFLNSYMKVSLWHSRRRIADDIHRAREFQRHVHREEIGERPHIPSEVRRRVLAVGRCAECGSAERLSVDHVLAFSRGGSSEESNLQCLCLPCNIRKGAR